MPKSPNELSAEKANKALGKLKPVYEVNLLNSRFNERSLERDPDLQGMLDECNSIKKKAGDVFRDASMHGKTNSSGVEALVQSMFDSNLISTKGDCDSNFHNMIGAMYGVKICSAFQTILECIRELDKNDYNDHVGEQSPQKLHGKGDSEYCPVCDTDYDDAESNFECDTCISSKEQKRLFISGDNYVSSYIFDDKETKTHHKALIIEIQQGMLAFVINTSRRKKAEISVVKISSNHIDKHRVKEFIRLIQSNELIHGYNDWNEKMNGNYGVLCSVDLTTHKCDFITDTWAVDKALYYVDVVEQAVFPDASKSILRYLDRVQ